MTLMLHRGAVEVDYDALKSVATPEATSSHVPIPHVAVLDMVKYSLGYFGHEVVEEHHALAEDGQRYFGLLNLRSSYGDYTDTVGLRNSHDKTFPIGIAIGGRVFCCDNLSFSGDHVIRRKHTAKAKRDLPGLVAEIIEPLKEQRQAQQLTFDRYKTTLLTDQSADHAILGMYREGIINVTKIPDVMKEWEEPSFEEFKGDRNAWRLFNAATFALTGRAVENSGSTRRLHRIIDLACETVR